MSRIVVPPDVTPQVVAPAAVPADGSETREAVLSGIVDRVVAHLDNDDPRAPLVADMAVRVAKRFEGVPVRAHLPVLIERAVRAELDHPDLMARTLWRRHTPHELRLAKWDGSPGRRVPVRLERVDRYGR